MNFISWLSVAGICCLGAMSPGPSLAVVMRHTVLGSRRNGMVTGISHSLGVGFYALLTVSGLAALLALEPALQKGLTWAGGAYLVWLGVKSLRSTESLLGEHTDTGNSGILGAARDGLMISLLNPKLMIFFVALFSQFVSPEMSWTANLVMVVTVVLIDVIWYCVVATVLSQRGYLERFRNHALFIDRITGIVFLLLAFRVFTL